MPSSGVACWHGVLLLAALAGAPALAAPEPTDHFQAGTAAAAAGDLEAALAHFQVLDEANATDPATLYNLGVVAFRLARYDTARDAFTRVLQYPDWVSLAHYNLGLIALEEDRDAVARRHFGEVLSAAAPARLQELASAQLVGLQERARDARRWSGMASAAAGHDDNVMLTDSDLVAVDSDRGDYFSEILATGQRTWQARGAGRTTVDVGGYLRNHAHLDDFDFGVVYGAVNWYTPTPSGWQLDGGLRAELQSAGGRSYGQVFTTRLALGDQVDRRSWRIGGEVSYVAGGPEFDFIDGWRFRAGAQYAHQIPAGWLRLAYELEINDRRDLKTLAEFSSYSPTLHRLSAAASWSLTGRASLSVEGILRASFYDRPNHFFSPDAGLVTAYRDQQVASMIVTLGYQLDRSWRLWAQHQSVDSASDIDRYDYDSHRYVLGIERVF